MKNIGDYFLKCFMIAQSLGLTKILPDKLYLSILYRFRTGKKLRLNPPETFNEKLQWLKLYDRRPIYTTMVDKYTAKKYVADIIGEEYIIPTLGVWDTFEEIDFDSLPEQFVLKCTHDSGGLVICRDKRQFDVESARIKITRSLKDNYYWHGREWPYKNVKPRIMAEQYMVDESGIELKDYKFFCFNGQVKCYKVDFDRFVNHRANYYDRNGILLPLGEVICPPKPEKKISMPTTLGKMVEFAEELASGHIFLRVDFYDVNGKIYFGELTFFPASGTGLFYPDNSWDSLLGEWMDLSPLMQNNK